MGPRRSPCWPVNLHPGFVVSGQPICVGWIVAGGMGRVGVLMQHLSPGVLLVSARFAAVCCCVWDLPQMYTYLAAGCGAVVCGVLVGCRANAVHLSRVIASA